MDAAMSHWGPHAGFWHDGPIAVGTRLLLVTPEDADDVQPLIEPGLVLAGRVRQMRPSLG